MRTAILLSSFLALSSLSNSSSILTFLPSLAQWAFSSALVTPICTNLCTKTKRKKNVTHRSLPLITPSPQHVLHVRYLAISLAAFGLAQICPSSLPNQSRFQCAFRDKTPPTIVHVTTTKLSISIDQASSLFNIFLKLPIKTQNSTKQEKGKKIHN
jgi:hypothetical protein